jgi:hypothetical protein
VTNRTAMRLAWGIGILCLISLLASLVLLVLDAKAIDSVFTAQLAWFLNCAITGVLGVLIATRRPQNPIGWLLLAIAFGNAVYLPADFVAIYGQLRGVAPTGWSGLPGFSTGQEALAPSCSCSSYSSFRTAGFQVLAGAGSRTSQCLVASYRLWLR